MTKKAKKITKIVISCITGLFAICALYLLICNIVAMRNEKPVRVFGFSYSYVPTASMEPTIKAGDSVIFRSTSYDSLEVGDIIVYLSKTGETKGMYIIHRIIEITDDGLVLKGDNNPMKDQELVTEGMLVGKYVKTFNFFNIGKLVNNKNVIYGILIVFFLGIMLMEAVNIMFAREKAKRKKAVPETKPMSEEEIKAELLKEMREELIKELSENKNEDE